MLERTDLDAMSVSIYASSVKSKVCSRKPDPKNIACCEVSGPKRVRKGKKQEKPKENQWFLKAPGGPREAQKGSSLWTIALLDHFGLILGYLMTFLALFRGA